MYSQPFAGFITGTVIKMGPKESDDFIAEESKGWVPRVEMVLHKESRASSCIQKSARKKAGRHFRSKEKQVKEMDFSGLVKSSGDVRMAEVS